MDFLISNKAGARSTISAPSVEEAKKKIMQTCPDFEILGPIQYPTNIFEALSSKKDFKLPEDMDWRYVSGTSIFQKVGSSTHACSLSVQDMLRQDWLIRE